MNQPIPEPLMQSSKNPKPIRDTENAQARIST
jgi:hypothetical protein